MLYCGKPPKEKYKKTGENIKKHDLLITCLATHKHWYDWQYDMEKSHYFSFHDG